MRYASSAFFISFCGSSVSFEFRKFLHPGRPPGGTPCQTWPDRALPRKSRLLATGSEQPAWAGLSDGRGFPLIIVLTPKSPFCEAPRKNSALICRPYPLGNLGFDLCLSLGISGDSHQIFFGKRRQRLV